MNNSHRIIVKIAASHHPYIKGKSIETALYEVVLFVEKFLEHGKYSLTSFLDIKKSSAMSTMRLL